MLGTDVDTQRLEVAEELGADYTVNRAARRRPVLHLGTALAPTSSSDCTGVSAALKALEPGAPLGTVVKIGWGPQALNFSLTRWW